MMPPPKPHKAYTHKHVKKEKLMDVSSLPQSGLALACDINHSGDGNSRSIQCVIIYVRISFF